MLDDVPQYALGSPCEQQCAVHHLAAIYCECTFEQQRLSSKWSCCRALFSVFPNRREAPASFRGAPAQIWGSGGSPRGEGYIHPRIIHLKGQFYIHQKGRKGGVTREIEGNVPLVLVLPLMLPECSPNPPSHVPIILPLCSLNPSSLPLMFLKSFSSSLNPPSQVP
jgi:hypothetical protein